LIFRRPAWHAVVLWNLALGAAGTVAAVLSGRMAEENAKHSFEIEQVLSLHEKIGYGVMALALTLAAVHLWRRGRWTARSRWVAWVLLAVTCGAMAFGAHLGGRLVYELGVGGSYGRQGGIVVTHEKKD